MGRTVIFQVNNSKYLLEILPDGLVTIWDTELESATLEWESCEEMPNGILPPSPIVAAGLTEEEAFNWLAERLGPHVPVTRIQ